MIIIYTSMIYGKNTTSNTTCGRADAGIQEIFSINMLMTANAHCKIIDSQFAEGK